MQIPGKAAGKSVRRKRMLVATQTGGMPVSLLFGYIIFFVVLMYFMAIRPQQKEKKKREELMASVAIGDTVLTIR